MDLATVGVLVGFAGVGWAMGNYDGDPDPRGWDAVVTFGPMSVLAVAGFALYTVANETSYSPAQMWISAVLGAGAGFVVGRLLGPRLKGRG